MVSFSPAIRCSPGGGVGGVGANKEWSERTTLGEFVLFAARFSFFATGAWFRSAASPAEQDLQNKALAGLGDGGCSVRSDACFCYQIQSDAGIGPQAVWPKDNSCGKFPHACQLRGPRLVDQITVPLWAPAGALAFCRGRVDPALKANPSRVLQCSSTKHPRKSTRPAR